LERHAESFPKRDLRDLLGYSQGSDFLSDFNILAIAARLYSFARTAPGHRFHSMFPGSLAPGG
jgi:hypothetical protein